ncbi:DEAD/DEAH box helicase family protein [Patescibacteria group bacterium]|nr:DEAD/DEAH box helicase family protein [Patescibacteria group bacterium]MBU1672862.1 DEAD/DEAH box helicase family protein [Patescibacteria group bacterium]MBU1901585.1 DEAD/DEAH box helicase family protein [Patescibacteria group bacterium]
MPKESKTRSEKIDKLLEKAGWSVVSRKTDIKGSDCEAIYEYPTSSGDADYLLTIDGKPVGVVEAKKEGTQIDGVLTQSLRYAEDLEGFESKYGSYKVPFVYSSNGTDIRFQNLRESPSFSRAVEGFHTPESLTERLSEDKNNAIKYLQNEEIKTVYGDRALRFYQKEAAEYVVNRLLNNKRMGLIAMATGTGKTFAASALMYHLMKSGYFKRILFLVDRRSLADQTVTALSTFEPEKGNKFDTLYSVYCDKIPTPEDGEKIDYNAEVLQPSQLKKRKKSNTFVYVSTIQRLYSMLKGRDSGVDVKTEDEWADGDDSPIEYNKNFPIDSFDLIISDECHRSIYNKWKYVLDYFDVHQFGLTATPAAHTAAYFDVHDEKDLYSYGYLKAVDDGYLVDFDAVRIRTDIDMKEEVSFSKGEGVTIEEWKTKKHKDELLDDDLHIDTSGLERKVTVEDRNRKIVKEVCKYIGKDEKTLVFSVNERHANQLVKLFRKELGEGDDVVQKITYTVDKPNELIRKFRNLKKPRIVVTVDMLSTGVDVPAIENLLIARPIRSRILYEQMIGRGTRLCKDINKTHFTVFDAIGVIDFMKEQGGDIMQPITKAGKTYGEIIKEIRDGKDIEDNVKSLSRKLQRVDKNITEEGRKELENRFAVPDGNLQEFSLSIQDRLAQQEEEALNQMSDPNFLEFLQNYPRYRQGFIISKEKKAEIATSEYIFRTTDGRELKPKDYLETFKQYIKQNAKTIEALKILLNSPRQFSMKHFKELKNELAKTPERFTEDNLRRANEIATHTKTPADLYAFVSHAMWNTKLYTPRQRIEKAFKIMLLEGETEPQQQWLDDIKIHLETNIIVESSDFRSLPFSRKGGFSKANRDFEGKLNETLERINEHILQPM